MAITIPAPIANMTIVLVDFVPIPKSYTAMTNIGSASAAAFPSRLKSERGDNCRFELLDSGKQPGRALFETFDVD